MTTDRKQNQIISYFTLRILIGATGVLLPFLLVIGKLIYNGSLQLEFSVSDYYDNGTAGDILVGILFVLGFFLLAYKGYAPIDDRAANLGCVFALGTALFPTTSNNMFIYHLHFVFSLLLFSVFIFFSLYLFRKSHAARALTKQKKNRNRVYLVCGIIMIICILCIAISMLFFKELCSSYHLVFWFESIALIAFGFSWVIKAEFLFWKDSTTNKT